MEASREGCGSVYPDRAAAVGWGSGGRARTAVQAQQGPSGVTLPLTHLGGGERLSRGLGVGDTVGLGLEGHLAIPPSIVWDLGSV